MNKFLFPRSFSFASGFCFDKRPCFLAQTVYCLPCEPGLPQTCDNPPASAPCTGIIGVHCQVLLPYSFLSVDISSKVVASPIRLGKEISQLSFK